jgi:pyruvate, orthophosphate dikinase
LLQRNGSAGVPKLVYLFGEGDASMRDLLGGKGAGLSEMSRLGLPVPPGFTITTRACISYSKSGRFPPGLWKQVDEGLASIEAQTRRGLGNTSQPLLVSVRSGAKFSMPGMMDTILNIGLNDDTVVGLARLSGNDRWAWDSYRRLVSMFGRIVKDIDGRKFEAILDRYKEGEPTKKDTDLAADALQSVVRDFKELYKSEVGEGFPSDPKAQLREAVAAVFRSWNGDRARAYREFNKIPHDLGTAASVQAMVFGNMGADSGTGVAFTRNPNTGEKSLYGEYLPNAQGEDVVAGIRTPFKISELKDKFPSIFEQLVRVAELLEKHYRDVQDVEFTVEGGRLWMLQTRAAKRTARAAVRTAVDMVREGLITKEEALLRVEPSHVYQLLLPRFDEEAKVVARKENRYLAKGLNASPGAATGHVSFDPDEAERMGREKQPVVLVRQETSPDDVHGMLYAKGILTAHGGATSHAAVVARGLGLPCVAGCEVLQIDYDEGLFRVGEKIVRRGDFVSIDGTTGEVFEGRISTIDPDFERERDLGTLLDWADDVRRLGVWANADYPRDANRARAFGAEGIGLCRTEHMFFETDRLPIVHEMILAAPAYRRMAATTGELDAGLASTKDPAKRSKLESQIAAIRPRLEDLSRRYLGSLKRLEALQRGDFLGILKAMEGLPVIIRLLDPPLHEFLPSYETVLLEVTKLRMARGDASLLERMAESEDDRSFVAEVASAGQGDLARGLSALLPEKEALLDAVEAMHEANPMLGLRGCRLGITFPEITEMQVRAIFEAACELKKQGVDAHPEIMIPLVGHVNELKIEREALEAEAKKVMARAGVQIDYKFGTMIEIPRAALTADEIATQAEFFSFGTNDLTQMTFGYSRDDAEGKFLLAYVDRKILPENPFQSIDRQGVGQLMRICVQKGRKVRPALEVGICGEHGGDPASIELCHELGLDYVSCSPFRVPVARLAAAQAKLHETGGPAADP